MLFDQGLFTTAEDMLEHMFDILDSHAMVVVDDWNSGKNRDWNSFVNKIRTSPMRANHFCTVVILTKQHLTKSLKRSDFVKMIETL